MAVVRRLVQGVEHEAGLPGSSNVADELSVDESLRVGVAPTSVGEGALVVEGLLPEVSNDLGLVAVGVNLPLVTLGGVPDGTSGSRLGGQRVLGLIGLEPEDVLTLGSSFLGSCEQFVGGLRNLDAELLEFSLVVDVDQRAGVLGETDDLVADRHLPVGARKVVLVLLSFAGDVLDQALDVHVRDLGISGLHQAGGRSGLDVGLELRHELVGLAWELRRLDLDVGVLGVPLLDDVSNLCHALAVGKTMQVLNGDRAGRRCGSGLRSALARRPGSFRGTATGTENERSGDHRSHRGHPTSTACDHVNPLP